MMPAADTPRPAEPRDRTRLGELATLFDLPGAHIAVIEREGRIVAAAAIDPRGTAVHPDEPLFVLSAAANSADERVLLDGLIARLGEPAPPRLLAACDPLDAVSLARLEQLGFHPTGIMPWFEIGGGQVEYVAGYRDPAGSTLELARSM